MTESHGGIAATYSAFSINYSSTRAATPNHFHFFSFMDIVTSSFQIWASPYLHYTVGWIFFKVIRVQRRETNEFFSWLIQIERQASKPNIG